MSSPDSRFERRIEEAARSLQRPAPPGSLERIRERASDLGDAIETAARARESLPPLELLDVRIAAAARELKRGALAESWAKLRGEARARERRSRLRLVRGAAALAATLLLGAWIFHRVTRPALPAPSPALLTSAALAQSRSAEARFEGEAARLQERVGGNATLAENEAARSLLEEAEFLDQAIEECRRALAWSPAHGHLREQLVDLTGRRVDLLRRAEAAGRGGDGESGGPRG